MQRNRKKISRMYLNFGWQKLLTSRLKLRKCKSIYKTVLHCMRWTYLDMELYQFFFQVNIFFCGKNGNLSWKTKSFFLIILKVFNQVFLDEHFYLPLLVTKNLWNFKTQSIYKQQETCIQITWVKQLFLF